MEGKINCCNHAIMITSRILSAHQSPITIWLSTCSVEMGTRNWYNI